MNFNDFETYLFDFDGTLVDSMPTFISTMLGVLEENNISYPENIVKIITPLGLEGTSDYFINELGLNIAKSTLMDKIMENMIHAYHFTIPFKENVGKVLIELKNRGASLNILTASPHITLDACLKRLGLWEIFDNIWSCDDFGTTKADPNIYVMAAQRLGKKPQEVLFLDDNINADITAKQAGMHTCGVYDKSSEDNIEQMKSATDFYIYDFLELV